MALNPVTIPLTFSGGVDTKTDPKSVAPVQLTALENGVFAKGTTIVKRTGYDGLALTVDGTTAGYGTPRALASRGSELCLFADAGLYSYRESSATWSHAGPAASIVHTERAIAATGTDQAQPDAATANGVTVAAWEDSRGGVWWAVVEATSQRMLRPPEQLMVGGQSPRCVRVGALIHVYAADAAGGQILCYPVSPSDYLTAPVPVVVTADLSTSAPYYDAVRHDDSVGDFPCLIAWQAPGDLVSLGYVDAGGALSGVASWSIVRPAPVAVAWTASTVWGAPAVGFIHLDGSDDAYLHVVEAANLAASLDDDFVVAAPNMARVSLCFDAAGTAIVAVESPASLAQNHVVRIGSRIPIEGAKQATAIRGHGLVSRMFVDESGAHVFVAHAVPFFPYVACLRVTSTSAPAVVCVGRHVVGTSDGLLTRGHLPTVDQDADDARVWLVPLLARQQVNVVPGVEQFTETGIQIARLDFDSPEAYQTAELGRDLVIAGACPLRYDGDTAAELGFHTAPDGTIALTESTAIGPTQMEASKTYLYQFAYEERDAAGVIHPGPMSVPQTVTLGASGRGVTIQIPTYRLTSKRRVTIGVWRSEADDTTGEPLLYRVTSLDPSATGANGYVTNDTGADTVTFLDEMPDATLITRERAYTNGGVLSNDPAPLGHVVIAGKGRLFFSDPTDPQVVRYTQKRRDGYGPEVSADLSIRVDGDDIVALAELDDAVLVFAAGSVQYFSGDGPLPNPDAAPQIDFSPPNVVTGDVGCLSQRSLAVTPDRVLFQSARGIYQIDRARQVGYVGAPVEAYNAQTVTSADAIPGKTQVVFLTSSGLSLLYDYFFGQWSTFTNHEGLDAVTVGGRYHYLRADPDDRRVFRSSATSYLDGESEIRLRIETAWIKLAGYHQAFQKVWHALFLGTWKSAHKLRVSIAIDYQAGWGAPYDLDVDANLALDNYGDDLYGAGVYGGDSDSLYQRRIHVGASCQSIRFAVEDVTSGTPLGASFELTELLISGGIRKATAPTGAARTN